MIHLKQHVFNSGTDICIACGADLQEADLPCDQPLQSAPDYFDRDDACWEAEESENALRSKKLNQSRSNYARRTRW